ncbi:MAG: AMP-binding protein [Sandaracinaceae bacterium]|nr:AMP-binding protein [Sandaracinaceae bacterium]
MTDTLFERLAEPDDRVALRLGDDALTYRQLSRACRAHVGRLREAGVVPGERVAVWTHPSMATMVALAAQAAAGIVTVPLNPKLGAKELAHVLGDASPRVLVSSEDGLQHDLRARVELDAAARLDPIAADASPMLILYTSGTTGAPKGAVLTRRNVAFDLDALAAAWQQTVFDTIVHALPLFHVHGLVLGLYGALRAGATLALVPRFEPPLVARALRSAPSLLFAVPTMVHRLCDAAEDDAQVRAALAGARLLISGSAGLPVREHRRIEALTGRGVLERYGLTETLINTAVRAAEGPRPGLVGRPLDGIELRLADDARAPLDSFDDATIGEIAVRGPNVFAGYLNRPDATAAVIDEAGFFYPGDLATRTEDGAIRIVGRRATDLIKTGGFKVGAGEIEAALLEHPSVAEAAVVGLPDEDLGERIVAFVVARGAAVLQEELLIDHVAAELAPHKRPREVRIVAALPRNAMGKVIKSALR